MARAKPKLGARKKSAPPAVSTGAGAAVPDVGTILKQMREKRQLNIRDVAAGSELSASFLSAVERGESDISLGRLARIAAFFEQDIGSLLGYTSSLGRPKLFKKKDRIAVKRGRGVLYELVQLVGSNLEMQVITLDQHSAFRDELTHEGIDIILVLRGGVTLVVDHIDYVIEEGDAALYSAALPHKLRNDSAESALVIGLTTGRMI